MNARISHRRERWTGRMGAVATVLAGCLLLASLPAMAGAGAPTKVEPRPMAAPAPLAVADFPGHGA